MPPTIDVVVKTLSDEDFNVNGLEWRVREARDQAGQELMVKALESMDERVLADHPGAARQRRVERHLGRALGHVCIPSAASG